MTKEILDVSENYRWQEKLGSNVANIICLRKLIEQYDRNINSGRFMTSIDKLININ